METPAYISAALPTEFNIMGKHLLPYSLGHRLHMIKHGCNFASDTNTGGSIQDLILGIQICSRTYEHFIIWLREGTTITKQFLFFKWNNTITWDEDCRNQGKAIKKYIRKKKLQQNLRNIGRLFLFKKPNRFNTPSINFIEKFNLFKAYMRDGCVIPKTWKGKEDNSKKSGADWTETLSLTLQSEYHKTENEVLNMPFSKVLRDYFIYLESIEKLSLKTAEEIKKQPIMSTVVTNIPPGMKVPQNKEQDGHR